MAYILSEIILFFYQLIKKNNKIVGLIGLVILGYLAGTASPLTTTDYDVYQQQYNIAGATGFYYFEKGYSELGAFFYHHGLSYSQFRFIFSMLIILFLYIGVCRFTSNIALFTSIYGITCFFNDATQIRNFMMISIVIIGISFLQKVNLKNIVLAILFIIIGAQFQSSGYFFLLIVLIRMIPEKRLLNNLKYIYYGEFFITLIILLFGKARIIKVLTVIASFFTKNRENLVTKIGTQYIYGVGIKKLLFITLCMVITLYLSKTIAKKLNNPKSYVLYCAIVTGMLCFPLVFIAIDYSRILRNSFLFFIILVSIFYSNKNVNLTTEVKQLLNLAVLSTCILFGFTNYYIWGPLFQYSIPYLAKIL